VTQAVVEPVEPSPRAWLMFVHQLPPEPPALRVRVWRRLQAMGALQLKSSVYLLPDGDAALEDFAWLVQDVRSSGAEATLWRTSVVAGIADDQLIGMFQKSSSDEYEALERELRRWDTSDDVGSAEQARALTRLGARFAEVAARDHFGAPRREVVGALLDALRRQPSGASAAAQLEDAQMEGYRDMTWVTRSNVKVDRMSSAWLIRRFIDPQARFAFTVDPHYPAQAREQRFDMYQGEFTHAGDLCTFEVLLRRFQLSEPALARLGEIVHDIDLKDARYGHPETPGIAAVMTALVRRIPDDLERIGTACTLLDGLLDQLRDTAAPR
jgi:hypothetical protein